VRQVVVEDSVVRFDDAGSDGVRAGFDVSE